MTETRGLGRALVVTAPIGDHRPQVSDAEVSAATATSIAEIRRIDLNDGAPLLTRRAWTEACDAIARNLETADRGPQAVLGIGPIPLLAALGRMLGDKQACVVHERHRHSESWVWEAHGDELGWRIPRIRGAPEDQDVVVLLSVSGPVRRGDIPAALRSCPIYELDVDHPKPNLVRTRAQLAAFAEQWRALLNGIRERHGSTVTVHLLPACPVSVAVELGRRMLPKVDPKIRVYDWRDKRFHYALTLGAKGVWCEKEAQQVSGCDILFVVALREEFERLYQAFPSMEVVPDERHGHSDFLFEVAGGSGSKKVVARLVGQMGTDDALTATDRAIERWSPSFVVNLGIAASLNDDVKLGDVVVANHVDHWDANGKAVGSGKRGWKFQHRGEAFQAPHALVQAVNRYEFAHRDQYVTWFTAGAERMDANVPSKTLAQLRTTGTVGDRPRLHVGHLASGSLVGAAEAFRDFLKTRDGAILALEMEAAGMARAASKRKESIPWLVVRGISDPGSERKKELDAIGDGVLRRIAMDNAVELVVGMVGAGALEV